MNIHRFLSSILKYKKDTSHLETMKKFLDAEHLKNLLPTEKIDLYFALGKANEDIND